MPLIIIGIIGLAMSAGFGAYGIHQANKQASDAKEAAKKQQDEQNRVNTAMNTKKLNDTLNQFNRGALASQFKLILAKREHASLGRPLVMIKG